MFRNVVVGVAGSEGCRDAIALSCKPVGRSRSSRAPRPAGVDLLVVGSSCRGVLGRVLLGDDTHAALDGAPYPVAIAPTGYEREPGVTPLTG